MKKRAYLFPHQGMDIWGRSFSDRQIWGSRIDRNFEQKGEFSPVGRVYPQFLPTYPQVWGRNHIPFLFCFDYLPAYVGVDGS